jgi:beta-galactosidase
MEALLTVIALPTITTHPSNQTVAVGNPAAFTVTAKGTGLTYQWQEQNSGSTTWSPVGDATGTSYTTTTSMDDNGKSFRCVVATLAGSAISDPAMLTVIALPTITGQPANTTVTAGETAEFSVMAEGSDLTYQWRKNGEPISGAQSNSYTTPVTTATDNGATFVCVVTTLGGSVTSEPATLTVTPPPIPEVPGLLSPVNGSTGVNTSPTLEWNTAARAESYDVQISEDASFSGATATSVSGTSYPVSGLDTETEYYWRVLARNGSGPSEWSDTYSFTTAAPTVE